MPTRRREQRIKSVLPVRVFGTNSLGVPFSEVAHTLDLSRNGVRVGGLRQVLEPGEVVGIQRGNVRARFRVTWMGQPPMAQDQFGLVCLEPEKNLWNLDPALVGQPDLPDGATLATSEPPQTVPLERRAHPRIACDVGVELNFPNTAARMWAHCSDISLGGCYVNTRTPLSAGSELTVVIRSDRLIVAAAAIVRTSHPQVGMGLQFRQLRDADRDALRAFIAELNDAQQPERIRLAPLPMKRPSDAQIRAATDQLKALGPLLENPDVDSTELAELRSILQRTVALIDARTSHTGPPSIAELPVITRTVS